MAQLQPVLMPTLFAGLLALVGCGGSDGEKQCNGSGGANTLTGSYCEDVEMRFSQVRLLRVDAGATAFLRIEYVRPLGTGLEKTLMVILDTGATSIETGTKIDLLGNGGSVTRLLVEGSINLTPELEAPTTVEFETYSGELGSSLKGQVDLSFSNGRKLTGTFEGILEDALPMD